MPDLNFENCIDELKEIHRIMPDLRFGEVVQLACDEHKRRQNTDVEQLSTKVILQALRNYKEKHSVQRKLKFEKTRGFGLKVSKTEVK